MLIGISVTKLLHSIAFYPLVSLHEASLLRAPSFFVFLTDGAFFDQLGPKVL